MILDSTFIAIMLASSLACVVITIGIIPVVGIGFHSFLDGIIYSVTFNVRFFSGALAAVRMVLHEFPEGIV